MDLLKNRRDAAQMGQVWDKTIPMVEGEYPGAGGRSDRKGNGTAASDNNLGWDVRAQSWQRGADTDFLSVEAEKIEQDLRWGTPHTVNFPAPSDPQGPVNCGARYQTASYDANDPLPNPHNFSSNPGFMSSASAAMSGGQASIKTAGSGTVGRTATASKGNASLPAPGSVDPGQDGGPLQVTSGYSG